MQQIVLSTAYLAPIQYYSKFVLCEKAEIEQYESYPKQTYRNRCRILGANGPLELTVPVIKPFGNNTLVKDIKIDYATRWQNNHWRSIISAYNSSPFLEYYIDDFKSFFTQKTEYLLDFNQQLQNVILEILEIEVEIELTSGFIKSYSNKTDYRNAIHPKTSKMVDDMQFNAAEYTQTFFDKMGFHPNLSILDLIFNQGPDSTNILKNSIV